MNAQTEFGFFKTEDNKKIERHPLLKGITVGLSFVLIGLIVHNIYVIDFQAKNENVQLISALPENIKTIESTTDIADLEASRSINNLIRTKLINDLKQNLSSRETVEYQIIIPYPKNNFNKDRVCMYQLSSSKLLFCNYSVPVLAYLKSTKTTTTLKNIVKINVQYDNSKNGKIITQVGDWKFN